MFFGPVVNAARAIALQIQSAIIMFVNNIIAAIRPQVVKNYAVGNYHEMYVLTFSATRFTYYMMLLLMMPFFFEINTILQLWLGDNVPEYTSVFSLLILLIAMINTLDLTILMAFHAIGKIKFGNIVGGTLMILALPISYIFLRLNMPPQSVFEVVILINVLGLIFDLLLTRHYVLFSLNEFFKSTIMPMIRVTILSLFVPSVLVFLFPQSLWRFVAILFFSELTMLTCIWFLGITKQEKSIVLNFIKSKLKR